MKPMQVVKQLNPGPCLTYLVYSSKHRKALLVDPLEARVGEYIALLKEKGIDLEAVLDTHTHDDHVSGGALLAKRTGCRVLRWVGGTSCTNMMHSSSPAGSGSISTPTSVSGPIDEGEVDLVEGIKARMIHVPGHTADSICIVLDGAILTGDTLFLDEAGAGRDDHLGGDASAHFDSLQRLKELPPGLLVLPGHEFRGSKPTTLRLQVERNPAMGAATLGEYMAWMDHE